MTRSTALWTPRADRPDPVAILAAQARTRLPELLPLRYERMRRTPFTFFRGAAAIMAQDLATLPHPGLTVQLCGDAHVLNFGTFASPEGTPVFDVNDFDETLPGPFDWDLRRLATSLVLSGREQSLSEKICRALAKSCATQYRKHLARLAPLAPIDAWQSVIDVRAAIAEIDDTKLRRRLERRTAAALQAGNAQYNLLTSDGAGPRIADGGNVRHLPAYAATIDAAFAAYPATLVPHCADLVSRYALADRAFKVVGVGSVGTFCAIALFASAQGAPLLLQLKEAQPSALAAATQAPPTPNEGERVVIGQRRLQAQSDIFLGWTPHPIDGRSFYVRRLKDGRLASVGAAIEADLLPFAAALCGRTLARAHGRAGDAARLHAAISGTGDDNGFERAIATFATAYADQTAMDHTAFCQALDDGTLPGATRQ